MAIVETPYLDFEGKTENEDMASSKTFPKISSLIICIENHFHKLLKIINLTNSMAYGNQRFNAAFLRALQ